jgi:hypothetical protein
MNVEKHKQCPISGLDALETQREGIYTYRIHAMDLTYSIHNKWDILSTLTSAQKGKLFQWVYKKVKNNKLERTIDISSEDFDIEYKEALNQKITPTRKLNLLLEYIYHDVEEFGLTKALKHFELFPILATVEISTVERFMQILLEKNYICGLNIGRGGDKSSHHVNFGSTIEGFEAYEAYRKGKADSDFGFMALKFSTDEYISPADEIYKNYWKKAVQEAGYPLNALYEKSEAGNINNSMEAQIRKCKFLIADVTPPEDTDTPNPNVMWEAGFAEGLNKPVFYVCDKNKKPKKRVFDIDHHNTLYYDTSKMKEDCEELKATIFNTFAKDAQ